MLLAKMQVANPRGSIRFKADVFPDADRRELRAPIPAKLAGRFAQIRPAGDCLGDARHHLHPHLFRREAHRRGKTDLEFVRPRASEKRLYVPAVLAEHVVRCADDLPIEHDRREGIQTVANQPESFFLQKVRGYAERKPVLPIRFGDPLDALFVIPPKWVGDGFQSEQVSVHSAGHLGWPPFLRS